MSKDDNSVFSNSIVEDLSESDPEKMIREVLAKPPELTNTYKPIEGDSLR